MRSHDLVKAEDGEAAWQLLRHCQPVHMTNSGVTGSAESELTLSVLVSQQDPPTIHRPPSISPTL